MSNIITKIKSKENNTEYQIRVNDSITFGTGAISLKFTLDGIGKVKVDFGDGTVVEKLLNGKETFKHRYAGKITHHIVTIEGASNVKVLFAPENNIDSVEFTANNSIEKVVLYSNNLNTLDVSMLGALQYLHIFNNPVCANRTEIEKTYKGLTDRNSKAFGSIIMYPFYPLGVLIHKSGNTIKKYPNNDTVVTPVEGQFYRDMNVAEVKWYKYENSAFVEQTEQNRLINLRIEMEKITLPLGWLFGSAIQYDETEYAKCDFYFKQNHVQDYWETAEKGLGLTIGMFDNTSGLLPDFADSNIKAYTDRWGNTPTPRTTLNLTTTHGDRCLSTMSSRGKALYGISPDCSYYLVDAWVDRTLTTAEITESYNYAARHIPANSDTITASMGMMYMNEEDTAYYVDFAKKNPMFSATGNEGDGKEWTDEGTYDVAGGNLGAGTSFIVGGINSDDTVWSMTKVLIHELYGYRGIFVQYGDGVGLYAPEKKLVSPEPGTSYSCPMHTAIVMLMKNVFDKLYGKAESYGKGSDFMKFVIVHTNPLYDEMNKAVGNGRADLMYYNALLANDNSVSVTNLEIADVNAIHGGGVDISPIVTPENADTLKVTYDYDMSKLAIVDDAVYPLVEQEETIGITAYSNMNGDVTSTFNVAVPATTAKTYEINESSISYDDRGTSRVKNNYTLQVLFTYPDIDTNTSKNPVLFEDDIRKVFLNCLGKSAVAEQKFQFVTLKKRDGGTTDTLMQTCFFKGQSVEELEGKNFVVSFVFEGDYLKFYLNGNLLGTRLLRIDLPIASLTIDESVLPSGKTTADCVRIYDRVLTHEEVIQNTIALLNGNGKE